MKPLFAGLAALLLSAAPPQTAEVVVRIDPRFNPDRVTITAVDSVLWNNFSADVHTVTTDVMPFGVQESFDSGDIASGTTFRHYFRRPGTYPYHCRHHPDVTGVVVVTP